MVAYNTFTASEKCLNVVADGIADVPEMQSIAMHQAQCDAATALVEHCVSHRAEIEAIASSTSGVRGEQYTNFVATGNTEGKVFGQEQHTSVLETPAVRHGRDDCWRRAFQTRRT